MLIGISRTGSEALSTDSPDQPQVSKQGDQKEFPGAEIVSKTGDRFTGYAAQKLEERSQAAEEKVPIHLNELRHCPGPVIPDRSMDVLSPRKRARQTEAFNPDLSEPEEKSPKRARRASEGDVPGLSAKDSDQCETSGPTHVEPGNQNSEVQPPGAATASKQKEFRLQSIFDSLTTGWEPGKGNWKDWLLKLETFALLANTNQDSKKFFGRDIGIHARKMFNEISAISDLSDLVRCASALIRSEKKVDRLFQTCKLPGSLRKMLAERRVELSKPDRVTAGLKRWVDQGSDDVVRVVRLEVAKRMQNCLMAKNTQLDLTAIYEIAEVQAVADKLKGGEKVGLTELPSEIGAFDWLTHLYAGFGNLQSLPESIQLLSKLRTLDLSENDLDSLPDFIASLRQLRYLDVSQNLLCTLPDSIRVLQELETLNVQYNHVVSLPELDSLAKLKKLYVDKELIEELSGTMRQKCPAGWRLECAKDYLEKAVSMKEKGSPNQALQALKRSSFILEELAQQSAKSEFQGTVVKIQGEVAKLQKSLEQLG